LPELLIAIVILAIGILSLVVTQAYVARGRSQDQTHLVAAQQAQSALASIADRACDDFDQSFDESAVPIADDMTRTVSVQDGFKSSPNLRLVNVEITYQGNHGSTNGKVLASRVLRRAQP
jgi:Tfp pilus assembly protein PilV